MATETPYRDALARLVDAHDAWEADALTPKVDLARYDATNRELEAAKAEARELLDGAS